MKNSMALAAVFLVIAIAIPGCWNKQTTTRNTVKRRGVVPLTGNAGVLGDYTLKGLQLAVDDQNSKGGLLGKKIELDVQDSKADPKEGVAVVKNMLAANLKPFLVYSIIDRKSTRLNSSHVSESRMPSS